MSRSLLYHAWSLQGYHLVSKRFQGGAIYLRIQPVKLFRCSGCGSNKVIRAGQVLRNFRTVPIGHKPVWIELPVQRLYCRACGRTRQAELTFAEPRRSYTRQFERFVLELSQYTTIQDAARHLGVGWDLIKEIQKQNLQRRYAQIPLRHLRHLAIDEISIGHGHRYLTIVLDLDSGAVVFVGEGRGTTALEPFWKRLRKARAQIAAVATDMSPAYTAAVHTHLPDAIHVFDRFHVVKLFNEKLSQFRQELQREAEGPLQKKVLKGTRWLLLKNPENLDAQRHEHQRLEEALALNKPLATAYYLKEDLRQIWEQKDKSTAARFLKDWMARARSSGIRMLQRFANTLGFHRSGILAYYDCRLTTAALEGTNNKMRTMQRRAYGFRDQEFFKLKIYAIHKTTYALVG